MSKSGDAKQSGQGFDYNVAMRRLIYVVGLGCSLTIAYGLRSEPGKPADFLGVTAVGLMAAGAALLTGGLLGFLFGVPHTRDERTRESSSEMDGHPNEQSTKPGRKESSTTYRANTSLEQISDWLSKMLVGVGLVEIKIIPGRLKALATYVASGLGKTESAEVFALTIIVYFSVCGFVFGFLWARLYLARWFREADEIQILGEKINRLESQQQADARALAVISQLNRQPEDPPLTEEEVTEMIKQASQAVRSQIFAQAEKTSANTDADNYDSKNQAVISILKGLISSDTTSRYHRNHSELSYALRRRKPPDWQTAEQEITKAIEIRDKMEKKGWRYYEFHRARCLIGQDPNFKRDQPSASVDRIINDLRLARSDDRWDKWYKPDSTVARWIKINKIDVTKLQES